MSTAVANSLVQPTSVYGLIASMRSGGAHLGTPEAQLLPESHIMTLLGPQLLQSKCTEQDHVVGPLHRAAQAELVSWTKWSCALQGVILVVDAADQAQLSDAKGIVQRLQAHTDLEVWPVH